MPDTTIQCIEGHRILLSGALKNTGYYYPVHVWTSDDVIRYHLSDYFVTGVSIVTSYQ